MKVPYLSYNRAMSLKTYAEVELSSTRYERERVKLPVSCLELISLIEQATSPNLGMATTGEIRAELAARGLGSPDDYRTFQPPATSGDSHG